MRLRDLDASFIRWEEREDDITRIVGDHETWEARGRPTETVRGMRTFVIQVETFAEAQGVNLQCPKCAQGCEIIERDGRRIHAGAHYLHVPFSGRGLPDHLGMHNDQGQPVRWQASGSSLDDLTTRPSILILRCCEWHGFITNGDAT